jgi:restriction system protein
VHRILRSYMARPAQVALEIPLLRAIQRLGGNARPRDVYDPVAEEFPELTDADRQERMESNGSLKWENDVQWARQRLVGKGEIDGSIRGVWSLTDKGLVRLKGADRGGPELLPTRAREQAAPARPAFAPSAPVDESQSPTEMIDAAHRAIRDALAGELLQLVLGRTPRFFEQLVVNLLVKMGYGGSRRDAGQALGRVGDGGIDGIIKEDRLGLGVIYVQAKRWAPGNAVGRPDLQQFVGALQDNRAQKGVFITTSTFTREATEFAARSDPKIALIDGATLASLMIEFGLGVTTISIYEIKRVDSDFFETE